jgi:hypothetical protein
MNVNDICASDIMNYMVGNGWTKVVLSHGVEMFRPNDKGMVDKSFFAGVNVVSDIIHLSSYYKCTDQEMRERIVAYLEKDNK